MTSRSKQFKNLKAPVTLNSARKSTKALSLGKKFNFNGSSKVGKNGALKSARVKSGGGNSAYGFKKSGLLTSRTNKLKLKI